MVDFFHAFDSPPKRLLVRALDLAGTPLVLLLLIISVYLWATTTIRGSDEEPFKTSKGVKQGCPMSCLIFVLFINAILIFLLAMGLKFSAYVDDISLVLPKGKEQAIFSAVQTEAAHYNMQLNVAKNEVMGLGHHCPPQVTLPSFSMPPTPVTA